MGNPFKNIKEKALTARSMANRRAKRFVEWQRKGVTPQPLSGDSHVCLNCSTAFTGNFCPRCGQ
ncbi:putative membrane protein [Prevotella sp. CAG:1058]|nr:putative membrane protein [Prevotella sp. CAG:1058]